MFKNPLSSFILLSALLAIHVSPSLANPTLAQTLAQSSLSKLQKLSPQANFNSQQPVTRAEMAAISLAYPHKNLTPKTTENVPDDVPKDHWAYQIVGEAKSLKLMSNYRDNQFFPDTPVNRAEGFSILAQVSGVTTISSQETEEILAKYSDSKQIPAWARKNLAVALKQGFINIENGLIRPQEFMTQGDISYALAEQIKQQKGPSHEILNIPEFLEQVRNNPGSIVQTHPENLTSKPHVPGFPWLWLLLGTGVGLMLLILVVLRRRNHSSEDELTSHESSLPTVKTLTINESELPKGGGTATIIQRNKKLRMSITETPVTFGTSVTNTYLIQNLSGVDQLFEITATKDGYLQLQSKKQGLTCDSTLVPPQSKGVTLPGDRTFTVKYQQRQFQIQPSFEEFNPKKAKQNNYLSEAWQDK
jgi:hypothetical protein